MNASPLITTSGSRKPKRFENPSAEDSADGGLLVVHCRMRVFVNIPPCSFLEPWLVLPNTKEVLVNTALVNHSSIESN